jgi:hypothetical protein
LEREFHIDEQLGLEAGTLSMTENVASAECHTSDPDQQTFKHILTDCTLDYDIHFASRNRGDVGAILRLNAAGRRYLVQDGFSISKGIEVLSAVSNEINYVFLHLLENPRLCDRSAVEEIVSDSTDSQGSRGSTISPANHNGKREQDQDQALEDSKRARNLADDGHDDDKM